ncbi:MAG TPA: hypothetical protein VKT73_06710 [Xanthobacteraceae bacterium]|nr:hypothetical protein [Xanthobacteraceae bacterium]
MTFWKKICVAAAIAVAGTATGARAQYVDPDYGGYAPYAAAPYGYYQASPYAYDEDAVIVRRPARYGYRTPSRDEACIAARRDFPERTNYICP